MASRAPFLKTRFSGYLHRQVPQEDAELTHVGPDTAGGEYLRRFWQPICFSDELKDLPHRVKILGEDLVVFRDLSGAVGLLELHCPHRGASLEYGLIDANRPSAHARNRAAARGCLSQRSAADCRQRRARHDSRNAFPNAEIIP